MALSHPEASGPTRPREPVTLLESVSPYGSRKVTVEYDGLTTAAYLHDETSAISATWIANHRPAPPITDQARLDAGRADQASGRPRAAAGRRHRSPVVRRGRRGGDLRTGTADRGHRRLVRHG